MNDAKENGIMERIFGTEEETAAVNIAFVICVIMAVVLIMDAVFSGINLELLKTITPVITLAIGFLFGKSSNGN